MDDPKSGEYNELARRLEASTTLRIPAIKGGYDEAPAGLLDNLLTFSMELNKASQQWQREKNSK